MLQFTSAILNIMNELNDSSFEQDRPEKDSISKAEVRASLSRVATSVEVEILLAEELYAIAIDPTVSLAKRESALDDYLRIAETARIKSQILLEVETDMGLNGLTK